MIYWDSSLILLLPVIALSMYAQFKVESTYKKYSKVATMKNCTGAETARMILDRNGLNNVRIESVSGKLTDHYDPRTRVLRLSGEVYSGRTVSASSIAAHECGHAIQHATGYQPLMIRTAIVPVVSIASNVAWLILMIGFLFSSFTFLLDIGIILFSSAVVFQLITLPVEFNASSRALVQLGESQILAGNEISEGKDVLNAAALTYVAAAAASVVQLLRLMLIRGRRN